MTRCKNKIQLFVICLLLMLAAVQAHSSAIFFDPKTYKGQVGIIRLPCAGYSRIVLSREVDGNDGDEYVIKSTEKLVKAPVGLFHLQNCELSVPCGKISELLFSKNYSGDADQPEIRIRAGKSVTIPDISRYYSQLKSTKTGIFVLPFKCQSSITFSKEQSKPDNLDAWSKIGRFAIPTGEYKLEGLNCLFQDGKGGYLVLSLEVEGKHYQAPIIIRNNGLVKWKLREPITASINVKQDHDMMDLTLNWSSDGLGCIVTNFNSKVCLPGFEILSRSGKRLACGKFQYG